MKIQTSKGFWVSSSFTERFGSEDITPAKTVPSFKVLPRDMDDAEIKAELGAGESTLEDVAAFLPNPPEGTDDGNWNIFYVAGCVVRVGWGSGRREWCVSSWRLDGVNWRAGNRVFSRNSPSVPLESSRANLESLTLESRVEALEERMDALADWAKSVSSFK